jgi:hypothetical protein
MSGAVVSVLLRPCDLDHLMFSESGPRSRLPDPAVAGVDEKQVEGSGDWPQLA